MSGAARSWCHAETARFRAEMALPGFWRALFGEFLGTLLLVLLGCGAASMDLGPPAGGAPLEVRGEGLQAAGLLAGRPTQGTFLFFYSLYRGREVSYETPRMMPHSISGWSLRWFNDRLVGLVGRTLCQQSLTISIIIAPGLLRRNV